MAVAGLRRYAAAGCTPSSSLVAVLIAYHVWCGKLLADFKHDRNTRSHVWFRWFNEFPVVILVAVVILAVVKPAS